MLHRVILGIAFAALSCAALLLGGVAAVESEWAEPRIASWAAERLERSVGLDTIDIRAAWPPRLTIGRLRVSNPKWATSPTLLEVEGLSATFGVAGWFDGHAVVERLGVERLWADLERDGRRATWRFSAEVPRVTVRELGVREAHVHYRDRASQTALLVMASGIAGSADGRVSARVSGTLHGTPLRAAVTAASVPLASDQVVPVSFEGDLGSASASGSGKVRADGEGLRGLDLQGEIAGPSLRHLGGLLGVGLPETSPYRLKGRVHFNGERWTFDPFRATVGASEVSGAWSHEQRNGRRYLRGHLHAEVLDMDDAKLGGGPGLEAQAMDSAPAPGSMQGWDSVNADLSLEVRALRNADTLPVDSVAMHAKLEDSLLRLDPLTLGMADSRVGGRVVIDPTRVPPRGRPVAWPVLVSSSLIRYREAITRIASALVQALRGTVTGPGRRASEGRE